MLESNPYDTSHPPITQKHETQHKFRPSSIAKQDRSKKLLKTKKGILTNNL